jgi:aspartyl-tRNA(Asn)/glutamyl-tRNA(Gln) amidotransferase subunit A
VRTVIEIAEAVRRGDLKAVDVLDECLATIDAGNERLNAFVHVDADLARRSAETVDAAVARGEDPGPFAGVPIGVKDLEDCAGMPTSHGSLLFKDRPPVERDSVHLGRLRAAGAVPVGKTAAPEFGITCFTSTKAWGTTRNPWDVSRTPGGSSGGSAAAVAAGLVPAATASDGGGSTRIPAAFSGLFGMKPSYGRIPHERPAASMTSVFGLLTTNVADAARHLDVVSGPSVLDRASLPPAGVVYERAIETLEVSGLRVAWTSDQGFAACSEEVDGLTRAAADALISEAGLKPVDVEISMPDPLRTWLTAGGIDLWMDIEPGMWPERADEFTGLARGSYRRTADVTPARIARWFQRRNELDEAFGQLFESIDVLLCPTTAVPAFAAEGPLPFTIDGRDAPAGPTPYTMLANLCWNPACSVPAGLSADGLPVGLQIVGRRHADDVVLRLARLFEQSHPWPRLAP